MTSAIEVGGSRSASRLLVGREDELARLDALVDEVVAAHRLGTVLVEGPAGMGKTRVVNELAGRVRARGVEVVVGHCVAQGEQMLPYAPVVELLTELVRREGQQRFSRLPVQPAPSSAGWCRPSGSRRCRRSTATGPAGCSRPSPRCSRTSASAGRC